MTLLVRIQILLLTLQNGSSLKRYSYKSISVLFHNELQIDLNFWWSHTFPPILYFNDVYIKDLVTDHKGIYFNSVLPCNVINGRNKNHFENINFNGWDVFLKPFYS